MMIHANRDNPVSRRFAVAGGLCLLACLLFSVGIESKEVTLTANLSTEILYTDNIGLTADNRESEVIPIIRPGITLRQQGKRLTTSIDYAPEARFYLEGTRKEELKHFLEARTTTEIAPRLLFLDATASITQNVISSDQPVGSRGIGSSNLTDSFRYSFSPYYTMGLGRFADFKIRYTYDRVKYSQVESSDSTSHTYDISLESSRHRTPWKVWYKQQLIDYDANQSDDRVKRGGVELGFPINRRWTLEGVLSYDDYDTANNANWNSLGWQSGLSWVPSPRTRLRFGFGKRFFGNSYYLDFSHQSKGMLIALSHNRDVTSSRETLAGQHVFNQLDESGQPIEQPAADGAILESGTATISNNYYTEQSSRASIALNGRRTSGVLGVTRTERDYQEAVMDSLDLALDASLNRRLSAFSSATLRFGWSERTGSVDYEERTLALTFNRSLSEKASAGLEMVAVSRNGSDELNSYDENRIRTYLNVRW